MQNPPAHPTQCFAALVTLLLLSAMTMPVHAAATAATPQKKAPAPAKPRQHVLHYVTINKRRYLYLREIAAFYGFRYQYHRMDKYVTLTSPQNEKIVFTFQSQLFTIKGITASLSYPVQRYRDDLMLETTDFQQFLDPIVRTAIIPRRAIRSVMIDPGHGGTDQGATAAKGKVEEKALNLQIATRLGNLLKQRGYIVHYTRTKDTAVTLPARSAAAAKLKPDLFISVHCNAHADPKINGIELFIANPAGVPSYGTTNIGKDCPSVKFNTTNALWAFLMQSALINATKATDRGIKRKQFAVIRETPTPAMLIEFGFLSNAAECKKLQDAKYQAKLATAVANGVDSLAKLLQPPSKAPPARGTSAPRPPARRLTIPKPPDRPTSKKP